MKINFIKKFVVLAAVSAMVLFQSCQKDPDPVIKAGADGFFVVNEGSYGNSNSSISFYDRKTNTMTNNVFAVKNGRPLGDQSQSMTVFEGKGYIVVQNSSKVEVINATTVRGLGRRATIYLRDRGFDVVGISTSREEPKFCTAVSLKPARSSAPRMRSTSADSL